MFYRNLRFNHILFIFLILIIPIHGWTSTPAKSEDKSNLNQPSAWKIIVKEPGIYKITYDDLLKYNINPQLLDLSKISIQNKGTDIPIYVSKPEGTWDQGDYIEFYGKSMKNDMGKNDLYTHENVYILKLSSPKNNRMIEISSGNTVAGNDIKIVDTFLDKIHLESEYLQRFHSVDWGEQFPNLWYWQYYRAPTTQYIDFSLPYIATESKQSTIQIRIALQGETRPPVSPSHHAIFYINDEEIGEAYWDGRKPYTFTTTFSHKLIKSGQNLLSVYAPGDIKSHPPMDIFYLEYVEFEYQKNFIADAEHLTFQQMGINNNKNRYIIQGFKDKDIIIYDINHGRRIIPVTIKDANNQNYKAEFLDFPVIDSQYIAYTPRSVMRPVRIEPVYPSDLKNTANNADYVILTYDDFIPELNPLVEWRQKQGHKIKVVKISDVYNEFNHGIFSPDAIRSFSEYVYYNWSEPQIKYLFLVGDANWDFKGNLSNWMKMTVQNYIPTYLYLGRLSYMESDNLFVTLDSTSPYPNIAVGRLTARTKEDVRYYIEKVLDYESNNPADLFNNNALLIAGEGTMFTNDLDQIGKDYLIPTFAVEKAYTLPAPDLTVGDVDLITKEKVIKGFNDGYPLIYYAGHGSHGLWSDRKLLTLDDTKSLTKKGNHGKYPIVLSMTCLTGGFSDPGDTSGVCELMVRKQKGGAIAAYGASGRASVSSDSLLGRGILTALLKENVKILGDAILKGLRKLHSSDVDMINMYMLFGDPALRVQIPENNIQISIKRDEIADNLVISGQCDKVSNAVGNLEILDPKGNILVTQKVTAVKGLFDIKMDIQSLMDKDLKYIRCSMKDGDNQIEEIGWTTFNRDLLLPSKLSISSSPSSSS